MTIQTIIELAGYLGSILVVISMLMTSVVRLRVINTIGSVIFCGYSLCIRSYPTAIMQACLITINVVSLLRLMSARRDFFAVPLDAADGFLRCFLERNKDDIQTFSPDFSGLTADDKIFLVTCGSNPAGILAAEKNDGGNALRVKLDYILPAYRNASVEKFAYSQLSGSGASRIVVRAVQGSHKKMLRRIGFEQSGDEFTLKIGGKV